MQNAGIFSQKKKKKTEQPLFQIWIWVNESKLTPIKKRHIQKTSKNERRDEGSRCNKIKFPLSKKFVEER